MNNHSIEEIIDSCGCICKKTTGISMNPFLISGRDTVFIVKKQIRLKKHQVGLFSVNGKYILHRVVKVKADGYDFCGDNNFKKELNIAEDKVFGVLEGYYKREKYYLCSSLAYKFKTRVWCFLPIKVCGILFFRLIRKFGRLFLRKRKENQSITENETTIS